MKLSPRTRRLYTSCVPAAARRWLERRLLPIYPREYDQRRFIFVHIPKTAGKSIASLLHNRGAVHLRYRDYERLIGAAIRQYFVFSVVRHPLDRLISAYAYLRSGGNQSREDRVFARQWIGARSLQEFIVQSLPHPQVSRSLFFLPQIDFLCDGSGRQAPIVLLRFENLPADFDVVATRLAIRAPLPFSNSSDRRGLLTDVDARALQVVRDLYHEDFVALGYAMPDLKCDTGHRMSADDASPVSG